MKFYILAILLLMAVGFGSQWLVDWGVKSYLQGRSVYLLDYELDVVGGLVWCVGCIMSFWIFLAYALGHQAGKHK